MTPGITFLKFWWFTFWKHPFMLLFMSLSIQAMITIIGKINWKFYCDAILITIFILFFNLYIKSWYINPNFFLLLCMLSALHTNSQCKYSDAKRIMKKDHFYPHAMFPVKKKCECVLQILGQANGERNLLLKIALWCA